MKSLLRFSHRNLWNNFYISSNNNIKRRSFKNFGHNEDKEPLATKIYSTFIIIPFFFLPINWTWLKTQLVETLTLTVPEVPKSYYRQEDD